MSSQQPPQINPNHIYPTHIQNIQIHTDHNHVQQGLLGWNLLTTTKESRLQQAESEIHFHTPMQAANKINEELKAIKESARDLGRLETLRLFFVQNNALSGMHSADLDKKDPSEVVELFRKQREQFEKMRGILRELGVLGV